jgi:hypothetical protein
MTSGVSAGRWGMGAWDRHTARTMADVIMVCWIGGAGERL